MEKQKIRVLVTKGKAGLGNRLLSVLGSILYANLSNRCLYIDWSDGTYSGARENAFHFAFKCKATQLNCSHVPDQDITPILWGGNLNKSVIEMIDEYDPDYWDDEMAVYDKYSIRLSEINYSEGTLVRWSYFDDFSSIFQKLGYTFFTEKLRFKVIKKVLEENIELTDHLKRNLDELCKKLLVQETIGVHIRLTDNQCPYRIILKKLKKLARERKKAAIFLATDNKKIEADMASYYPGRLLKIEKQMPDDGIPLHHHYHTKQAFKDAIMDMYLLSRCDYLIYSSQSSMGYCAALLSKAPSQCLINCITIGRRMKNLLKTVLVNGAVWKEKLWG